MGRQECIQESEIDTRQRNYGHVLGQRGTTGRQEPKRKHLTDDLSSLSQTKVMTSATTAVSKAWTAAGLKITHITTAATSIPTTQATTHLAVNTTATTKSACTHRPRANLSDNHTHLQPHNKNNRQRHHQQHT